VLKEKYIVCPAMPGVSDVIHGCDALSLGLTTALYRGW
jgi:hypothetical protein